MGLLSFLFSENKDGEIRVLQNTIENYKKSIENERANMARYRAQKAPQHYQENGKKKIQYFQQLIVKCRTDIVTLKKK